MKDAIAAEFLKLRTTRTGWWLLLVMLGLVVLAVLLHGFGLGKPELGQAHNQLRVLTVGETLGVTALQQRSGPSSVRRDPLSPGQVAVLVAAICPSHSPSRVEHPGKTVVRSYHNTNPGPLLEGPVIVMSASGTVRR